MSWKNSEQRYGSLSIALALPAMCYAIIAGFGVFARRPADG